jgi:site-specific DNA-methyltransferase (adenine-specific)
VPEPYWTDGERTLYHGDCLGVLPTLRSESVGLVLTDPPYSISFMGRSWDRALPDPRVWQECLRVLKPGGFLFAFMAARSDCLARFIVNLEDAGFDVSYAPILWTYLSGFPKGVSLSKAADKAAGAEREVIGEYAGTMPQISPRPNFGDRFGDEGGNNRRTAPASPLAHRLDGWFAGRQALKPAYEFIVVAQKPLSEKTFLANVVEHGVGGMNCGECAIPFEDEGPSGVWGALQNQQPGGNGNTMQQGWQKGFRTERGQGRFPANLVVTGQALGARSKYFDLDAWQAEHVTFTEDGAVVYCPKASRAEKERGLETVAETDFAGYETPRKGRTQVNGEWVNTETRQFKARCSHPTCKPLSLLCWLTVLGCPPGEAILDPFAGSGTGGVAAKIIGRRWIGCELMETEDEPYCTIASKRIAAVESPQPTLFQEAAGA